MPFVMYEVYVSRKSSEGIGIPFRFLIIAIWPEMEGGQRELQTYRGYNTFQVQLSTQLPPCVGLAVPQDLGEAPQKILWLAMHMGGCSSGKHPSRYSAVTA